MLCYIARVVFCSIFASLQAAFASVLVIAMAENSNDVFCMLSVDDKLDGDNNYPLWSYMMQHVLVSKGVWNIVKGLDVRPGSVDARSVEDVAGSSIYVPTLAVLLLFYRMLNRLIGMLKMRRLMP